MHHERRLQKKERQLTPQEQEVYGTLEKLLEETRGHIWLLSDDLAGIEKKIQFAIQLPTMHFAIDEQELAAVLGKLHKQKKYCARMIKTQEQLVNRILHLFSVIKKTGVN